MFNAYSMEAVCKYHNPWLLHPGCHYTSANVVGFQNPNGANTTVRRVFCRCTCSDIENRDYFGDLSTCRMTECSHWSLWPCGHLCPRLVTPSLLGGEERSQGS